MGRSLRRMIPKGSFFLPNITPRWEPIAVGDFNGDGISDIAWKHSTNGNVYVQLFGVGRVISGQGVLGNAINQDLLCSGDFDANTRHELMFVPKSRGNIILPTMWFPDATGLALTTTTLMSRSFSSNYSVTLKQCRDNDGDGKAEVIFKNAYGGIDFASIPAYAGQAEDFIWCMNGAAVKVDAPGSTGSLRNVTNSWRQAAIGDWRADGKFGVWWRKDGQTQGPTQGTPADPPGGDHYIYPLTGNTIGASEGASRTVAGLDWKVIASGQFDAVLGWDILFRNMSSGPSQRMYVYTIDNTIVTPFITANEGYVINASTYDGYEVIGSGNFNAAAGPFIDILFWNKRLNIAKIATMSFAFVGMGSDNFTISAGVSVPTPPL